MATLPLFPLRVVLYPQMPITLHVFEPRYQALLRDCRAATCEFGVVAIRSGAEVGGTADPETVGTVAAITEVRPLSQGRSQLTVTGGRRFAIRGLIRDRPYLRGEIELLEEQSAEPGAFALSAVARHALARYLAGVARLTGGSPSLNPLPDDPLLLSWVIAATLAVDLYHRQRLLEEPSVSERLRQEITLLRREAALLERQLANRLPSRPSYTRN